MINLEKNPTDPFLKNITDASYDNDKSPTNGTF